MAKGGTRRPPRGRAWLAQIFDKAILRGPDGVVFRKVTSVERYASETLLLDEAAAKRLSVTRIGSHYAIHSPLTSPKKLF